MEASLATCRPDLAAVIRTIATAAAGLAETIAVGPLAGAADVVGQNADGDRQTRLDLAADEAFRTALATAPVRWYASEEADAAVPLDPAGTLGVVIDPLDGSGNIDTNVAVGTIFGIYDAEAILAPGRELLAAGYVIYGPQTALVLAIAGDASLHVLDRRAGGFHFARRLDVPRQASEFAINASNYRHWSKPVRAYIDDCLAGADGPRGKDFNMRWNASLVAETHRILLRGGIFLYPADSRPGYGDGRLRLVYEAAPIAFVVEAAGGLATDGCDRILDRVPAALHARVPLVFGSAEKVDRVAAYHAMPEAEIAPLFGRRGLFTA